MSIKTKSIFQPSEDKDGFRILVTRYYPRGVKKEHFDYWIRDLAPSQQLLRGYKDKKIDWKSFREAFLRELSDNMDSCEAIYTLSTQTSTDITLLCYEKDGQPCHRHILRDLIESPKGLISLFKSKNTDNHKGISSQIHITH